MEDYARLLSSMSVFACKIPETLNPERVTEK